MAGKQRPPYFGKEIIETKLIFVFGEGRTLSDAQHDVERSTRATGRAHALGDIVREAYQVSAHYEGKTDVETAQSYEKALDTLRGRFGNDVVPASHVLITRQYALAGSHLKTTFF